MWQREWDGRETPKQSLHLIDPHIELMDQIGRSGSAPYAETLEGLAHVPFDRTHAQPQIPCDLRIAPAVRCHADDFGLAA
jgi:hypothetical protein